jgi:phosphoglycerol transferase MdoB-like AlkP superfamily enzyme
MDFYLLGTAQEVFFKYFSKIQAILIGIIIASLVAFLIFLWKKTKKREPQLWNSILVLGVIVTLIVSLSGAAYKHNMLSNHFGNLPDAFAEYGFVYCFSNSVIERGISKPTDYSNARVKAVKDKLEMDQVNVQKTKPNIIIVQLESFFDVHNLLNYSYSDNPLPNFSRLRDEFSSGYLSVPAYGAGTVNTEFEVIAGMNTEYFGTGEYPYRTILKSKTSESICYNLSEMGYQSYAIHNNIGSFYDRNEVLKNLGFDYFISLEYMHPIEYNYLGWAKDQVLTDEIMKALSAKNTRDFIYTITVQSHGKYPKLNSVDQLIKVIPKGEAQENLDKREESHRQRLEYYVNQLSQTDQFIGELIATLSEYKEPTVVVFFGDHLPPLSINDEDLINQNKFQTEYILWSNYPMEIKDINLSAYQLSAYLMERVGYNNGVLTKLHQNISNNPNYFKDLKLLQYDMLYGKRYVFQDNASYPAKSMLMGINKIVINSIEKSADRIILKGNNFTPWSIVFQEGEAIDTEFVDENTLQIPLEDTILGEAIYVGQTNDHKTILSKSNEYVIN